MVKVRAGRFRFGILNGAVPGLERAVGAAQPAAQLVQEEAGGIAAEEIGQHGLGLAGAAARVDRLEDGDGVLEQELGVAGSAAAAAVFVGCRGLGGMTRVAMCRG